MCSLDARSKEQSNHPFAMFAIHFEEEEGSEKVRLNQSAAVKGKNPLVRA